MAAREAAIQMAGARAMDGRVKPGHEEEGWRRRSHANLIRFREQP
jgi:hypothetical protein